MGAPKSKFLSAVTGASGAGVAGVVGGTLIVALVQNLPGNSRWKKWCLLAAPLVTVGFAWATRAANKRLQRWPDSTMIDDAVQSQVGHIEADHAIDSREDALKALRILGIDEFGYLLFAMPNAQFPKLSNLLPKMASEEVQQSWTGCSGEILLRQTCAFVRSVAYHYTKFTSKPLAGSSILDFGCGYGRIARLMYYFGDPSNVVGVDPWDRSIQICHEDGMGSNFFQSSYLPTSLPVGTQQFDLIYAFSVFTHLSERAMRIALETLSRYLKREGLLVITIRPVEYWHGDPTAPKSEMVERQVALHKEKGFAFLPHDRPAVDGDVTYGDTSLTLQWLADNFPFFSLKGVDRSLVDPYQYYVFLQLR